MTLQVLSRTNGGVVQLALWVLILRLFPCVFPGFGNVVELRINTKGVGGKLPNFGFVVFDDSEPVQRILVAKVSIGIE